MKCMLCRNRVSDFRRWKRVFDSHARSDRAAGLLLRGLWRDEGKPNQVFCLFQVKDTRRAKGFICAPGAARAAAESGVIDGAYHFMRDSGNAEYRRPR